MRGGVCRVAGFDCPPPSVACILVLYKIVNVIIDWDYRVFITNKTMHPDTPAMPTLYP